MVNDTTTLNGALDELGETLADNLVNMGVESATAEDGLTTLAGKILDIPPTLTGVELDTDISCECADEVNSPFTVKGVVSASYNDESSENVDLTGFLQGATVKIYNGNTLLGQCVSNSNGEYNCSITVADSAPLVLSAVFEGTDDYVSCVSESVNVNVITYELQVSSDKDILSANDNESCVLTAVLTDNNVFVEDEILDYVIRHDGVVIDSGSLTTDSNGAVELEYFATGVGNVDVIFSLRTLLQETFVLEDNYFYDDALTDNTSQYQIRQIQSSNLPSMTHTSDGYQINGGTSTNAIVIPISCDNSIFEVDIKTTSYRCGTGAYFGSKALDAITTNLNCTTLQSWRYDSNGSWVESFKSDKSTGVSQEWVRLILEKQGNTLNITIKNIDTNEVITTWSKTLQSSSSIQWALATGGNSSNAYVKNIKIKAL